MRHEERLATRTPESRAFALRVELVMTRTAQLNALAFDDADSRRRLLTDIFGGSPPESLTFLPPFYCDYGLGDAFRGPRLHQPGRLLPRRRRHHEG